MTTPNLGLSVTSLSSGSEVTFVDWRLTQDGTSGSSNMGKIDTWSGLVSGSLTRLSGSVVTLTQDKAHVVVSSGNGTIYTATNTDISSYFEELLIVLVVDTTITGAPTLNINSMGAKSLKKMIGGASVGLDAGDLQASSYNIFVYSGGEFIWSGANVPHWTYLTAPLTSTSWDGDAISTTAKTLIDLSTVFGVPANVKSVLARVSVVDTSGSSNDCYLILSPNNTAGEGMLIPCFPSNTRANRVSVTVPCNTNGDFYYQAVASGAGTLTVSIQIWGYNR